MSAERVIQAAVARADLIICAALRWFVVVVPMALVLLLGVLTARRWMREDVDWIDYDAPGADITSEGPEETKSTSERGMW